MKKRILTGLKATSNQLHIGNYFGAIKPMIEMIGSGQYDESFLFVANMHSLTAFHEGDKIREYTFNIIKIYLSAGVDPSKTYIYNPALIPGHAQLLRVFSCLTNKGTLNRMHAYKDALNKSIENEISIGTYTYPILMAADILLYDADVVPVGKDQKQHVEYARDIAIKFNSMYGECFKVPEPYIPESVAVVPGIDGRKMSKSNNNYIGLLDDDATILKRVKSVVSGMQSIEEPKDPDSCNIYNILKIFLDEKEDLAIRKRYTDGGLSYKEVKDYLYEKVILNVSDIRNKFNSFTDEEVINFIKRNNEIVGQIADQKVKEVYKKVGFDIGF